MSNFLTMKTGGEPWNSGTRAWPNAATVKGIASQYYACLLKVFWTEAENG